MDALDFDRLLKLRLVVARVGEMDLGAAINALLAEGRVTKTGAKRGTRYHLKE